MVSEITKFDKTKPVWSTLSTYTYLFLTFNKKCVHKFLHPHIKLIQNAIKVELLLKVECTVSEKGSKCEVNQTTG